MLKNGDSFLSKTFPTILILNLFSDLTMFFQYSLRVFYCVKYICIKLVFWFVNNNIFLKTLSDRLCTVMRKAVNIYVCVWVHIPAHTVGAMELALRCRKWYFFISLYLWSQSRYQTTVFKKLPERHGFSHRNFQPCSLNGFSVRCVTT